MKKNKLKPFLTGSVFILPALLFLNGSVQETKAMMKNAVGKVLGNIKTTPIKIPNITSGGIKISSGALNALRKQGTTTTTGNKSSTLPNTRTSPNFTSNLVNKSNSFSVKTKRPAPQPPKSSSNLVDKINNAEITADLGLKPRRPAPQPPTSSNKLNSTSVNSEKPDPGYGTVPKPIFTPKDPNKPTAEPEQYENVVILSTNAGTLTIFKDH